mmetsp:Transcript_16426/g.29298  ORF Transcript_16426/g.29298 Transcript_16426/m.29298 type:complete len:402 (+) Transcript_16426:149-1354(+)
MPLSENLRNGGRPPAWAVEVLQSSLAAWMAAPPPYPADAFSGRGVVITGGHLRYWSGALAAFASLRKQGCRLPFELWVLEPELPDLPPKIVKHFSDVMGVAVRVLPKDNLYGAAGYRAKVSAILSSSFEEVLFLDADNIPLGNACALFDEPLYKVAGALFWKDFWEAVPAEALKAITRTNASLTNTHESGQMVIDKRRGWRELLTAAHINFLGPGIYYPMLSGTTGEGDKETFPYGFLLWGHSFGVIEAGVVRVGRDGPAGWEGSGMLQHSPAGAPLFLHANAYKPNFLTLPDTIVPTVAHGSKFESHKQEMQRASGYDVEAFVHAVLRAVRCDEEVASYVYKELRWRIYWRAIHLKLMQVLRRARLTSSSNNPTFTSGYIGIRCSYMHNWRVKDPLSCPF